MTLIGLFLSLSVRFLILSYSQITIVSVSGLGPVIKCYACKQDPSGTPGLITPCPDIANKMTTLQTDCPDGTCLTFTGSQEWRGKVLDGTLRLCVTPKVAAVVLPPNWIPTENQPENCQMVNTTSLHNQSAIEPCTTPSLAVLKISGKACTCRGNLCNGANGANLISICPWIMLIFLFVSVCFVKLG